MLDTKKCPHCKNIKPIKEFYTRREGKDPSAYCKICTNIQTHARQKALKIECLKYLGGKCLSCGYDKYPEALEFHHLNPEEKDFNISSFRGYYFERIKPELDKCVILCSNCHKETHADWNNKLIRQRDIPEKTYSDVPLDSYQKPANKAKIKWPSDEELSSLVWKYPRSHLSKVLKVSDVAIAKYLKRRGISQPPRGYWAKVKSDA